MSNRFDFGGVNLRASEESAVARPTSETPFCIAILGDFSGRANRGLVEPKTIGERPSYLVDRDNFDEVLSKLHPELHLPTGDKIPLVFRFSELEDFHPDRLFENEAFRKLKGLRERVQDSSAFADVAEELGLRSASSARENESPRVSAPSPVRLASGSLLDELIEQTESRVALESTRKTDEVHQFARELAAKYSVSSPDPRQPDVVAAVDRAISDAMRVILHHSDFQALEAIWRSTFLLVRQIETGPQLKIYLIDISKQELASDLKASEDHRKSGIFRLLVEKAIDTPGADPWTVVVGNFSFGSESEDTELLAKLAAIAQRAGAAFLGEADPSLLGCASLEAAPHPRDWNESTVPNPCGRNLDLWPWPCRDSCSDCHMEGKPLRWSPSSSRSFPDSRYTMGICGVIRHLRWACCWANLSMRQGGAYDWVVCLKSKIYPCIPIGLMAVPT
jgi:type VI secretion system protein ImpC